MSTQIAVASKFLSFLPHRCKPLNGANVDVDATAMNPGFFTPTDVTRNVALQQIVDRRVLEDGVAKPLHPELRKLRFALVDLTGTAKLAAPQFAGHNEKVQGGLGSLCKISCLYAAYQLKFDLQELARTQGLSAEKPLFKAARALWDATQKRDTAAVTTIRATGPKIELLGKLVEVNGAALPLPRSVSAPDLERMFDVVPGPGGTVVKFKGSDSILVDPVLTGSAVPHTTAAIAAYLKSGRESLAQVRKLSFAERLFLMIDESDNAACHACMENVSFLYIASSLWQSDLYRPQRGGGLWEASTHDTNGVRWVKPPFPVGGGADFVSATAASVATLFTLMEQDRLVSPDACAGMRQLTSKRKNIPNGSLTRSFFEEGLQRKGGIDRLHSKLGIGNFLNDGAIILRTIQVDPADRAKDRQIRYVASGFDEPLSQDGKQLGRLIRRLDDCILEHNGLPTP